MARVVLSSAVILTLIMVSDAWRSYRFLSDGVFQSPAMVSPLTAQQGLVSPPYSLQSALIDPSWASERSVIGLTEPAYFKYLPKRRPVRRPNYVVRGGVNIFPDSGLKDFGSEKFRVNPESYAAPPQQSYVQPAEMLEQPSSVEITQDKQLAPAGLESRSIPASYPALTHDFEPWAAQVTPAHHFNITKTSAYGNNQVYAPGNYILDRNDLAQAHASYDKLLSIDNLDSFLPTRPRLTPPQTYAAPYLHQQDRERLSHPQSYGAPQQAVGVFPLYPAYNSYQRGPHRR